MTRVKSGVTAHKRHKRLLQAVEGYRGTKSKLVKVAKESFLHAGAYAYHGRKLRKRDYRKLWITRINGAVRPMGLTYKEFVFGLKKANINLDRKSLSDMVTNDSEGFKKVVEKVLGR